MRSAEFRRLLERLELSQAGLAALLGSNDRTVRRWASGEAPVPRCVELVLKLMDRFGLVVADVEKL